MAPHNHKDWLKQPKMDYISSECYNNYEIFQEEQKEIFSKVWIPMCHISEMRNKGDFRTTRIADKELSQSIMMVRMFKAYYNTNDITFANHLELIHGILQPQKNHYTVRSNMVVWFG